MIESQYPGPYFRKHEPRKIMQWNGTGTDSVAEQEPPFLAGAGAVSKNVNNNVKYNYCVSLCKVLEEQSKALLPFCE